MLDSTKRSLIIISTCSYLAACNDQFSQDKSTVTKYEATWDSVKQHETPDWFLDAKFGIYFHWGPYSVPAHKTEWYSMWMYKEGHPIREYHESTYGPLDQFGYKDFIPEFTGEHFDADEWTSLFKKAGAKFVGPVSIHADGFAMWDSDLTPWNAKDMGPKRDIVGEMAKAAKSQNIKFIATFHHQWKYAWYPTWDESTDAYNPDLASLYGPKVPKGTFDYENMTNVDPMPEDAFSQNWLDKVIEVVDKYAPDLVYFDNKLNIISEEKRLSFLSYYYNQAYKNQQEVVVTYKFEDMAKGSAVLDLERARMSEMREFPWLTDDSIDWDSWAHSSTPNYKSTNRLIDFLVDVVSKNGAVLLNVTPTAQGVIPEPVRDRLLEMGRWLEINGEAIYGSRPWSIYGEGPAKVVEGHLSEYQNHDNTQKDIRFTTNNGFLYATVLDWPTREVIIDSLGSDSVEIDNIEWLGSEQKIEWRQTDSALIIKPTKHKFSDYAFVYKISLIER